MKTRIVIALAALVAGAFSNAPASALPKYAQKENKPCAYCHVKPEGGGKRSAAGVWYETHGLSFRGYVPPKPAPKKKNDKNTNKARR